MTITATMKRILIIVVVSVLLGASVAYAQHVQLISQAPTQESGLTIDGTETLQPGLFELSIGLNYARRPVIESVQAAESPLYGGVLSPRLALTYGFTDRLHVSFIAPWHRITADSPDVRGTTQAFGFQTRWRIRSAMEGRGLSSAIVAGINTAFEDDANLVSAGGALLYGRAVLQYGLELAIVRLSIGYEHDTSSAVAVQSIAGGAHAVTYAAGLQLGRLESGIQGFGELIGKRLLPRGTYELDRESAEAVFGIRVRSDEGVAMSLGGGRGVTDGFGSSAMRVLLQLHWDLETDFHSSGNVNRGDSDGDGIMDPYDQCPTKAEDRDSFRDGDGCPDLDNDRDGIVDTDDKCPDEAEDNDEFRDEDGCPDLDNDQDGILDSVDACPNDGPSPTETVHSNGCPLIQIHGRKLTIATPIRFDSGSDILPKNAGPILEAIARFMRARPTQDRLRVEGYTDLWGTPQINDALGKRRANAVKSALVKIGLSETRIEAFGRGTESPIGDGRGDAAAQQSRRVEFYLSLSERQP